MKASHVQTTRQTREGGTLGNLQWACSPPDSFRLSLSRTARRMLKVTKNPYGNAETPRLELKNST